MAPPARKFPANWQPITVDGEEFEWALIQAAVADAQSEEGVDHFRENQLCLLLKRAAIDTGMASVILGEASPPGVEEIADAIRNHRDRMPTTEDPRRAAHRHANALHAQWHELPLAERIELSRLWLARWERMLGNAPVVKDPSNLSAISVDMQLAAHTIGAREVEDERAAQERDVRAALERMAR
jgi:hypothetical protein